MPKGKKISLQTKEESISHAIVKARGDVNNVIQQCGYKPITFGSSSPIGIWRVIRRYYDIFSLKIKIKKDDTVFFQFPWIHNNKREFYDNLFNSGACIKCIVHDLDSFRYPEQNHTEELRQLNRCQSIIVHTPAMKDYIVAKGIDEKKIKLIYLFPYLTNDAVHLLQPQKVNTIIFAGNLEKSPFIHQLHKVASDDLHFNLYGKGLANFQESDNIKYKGVFSPDHPGTIEGNWGLVWDGEDIETCSGLYGNYLRYNSSHKISLYLSLGIPVILWSESSLKDYITSNGIGIVVDSLSNLHETLSSMDEEEIARIQNNARQFSNKLRNGDILKALCQ